MMTKEVSKILKKVSKLEAKRLRLTTELRLLDHELAMGKTEIEEVFNKKQMALFLTSEEKSEIHAGRYIVAIKSVRNRTTLGLKEAKDLVDEYRSTLEPAA